MKRLNLLAITAVLAVALAACAGPAASPTAAPTAAMPGYGATSGTPSPSPAVNPGGPIMTPVQIANNPKLGHILVDSNGMTLYQYSRDTQNMSNCSGQCLQNWPPLLTTSSQPVAPAGLPGALGVITRADGSRQVTYSGLPLYYYAGDTKAGDTNGQGLGGVWSAVQIGSNP